MKEWFRPSELAGLPGLPGKPYNITLLAKRAEWTCRKAPGREGGGGFEYHISSLPQAVQVEILKKETQLSREPGLPGMAKAETTLTNPSLLNPGRAPAPREDQKREHLWRRYERATESMKVEARRRLDAVRCAESLMGQGIRKTSALETASAITGDSPATIRRWMSIVRDCNPADRLACLLPGYSGRTAKAECSEEAWDVFKAFYLRPEQPSAEACYDLTLDAAKGRDWKVPSLKTMLRRVHREIPRSVRVLRREGVEALNQLMPHQERDHSVFHALEAVNADCHTFDNFVRFEDGTVDRPTGVFWQDIYSGKIAAFRLVRNPSAWATVLSFGDLISGLGIPSHIWLDNGREFAAKWLTGGTPTRYRFKVRESDPTGVFTQLGIEIHWCTPYHGQAKPIERAFRDFCDRVAKHPAFAGAYTGNNPLAKPENYQSRAVPFAEFEKIVRQAVAAHNARPGRESAVCRGRSFDQAFNESYSAAVIRKATAEQRALCLLAAESVTASRTDGAVRLGGNRYWSEELSNIAGRKVMVRFDPENLHGSVRVYELSGRFVCEAACVARVGFADREAAQEHARQKKRFRRATRELADAEIRMSALEAAPLLPEAAPEETPAPAGVEILRLPTRAREARQAQIDADEAFVKAALALPKARDVI